MVLNGPGRGCRGILLNIHEENYNCDIEMKEGRYTGQRLKGVEYEDISKYYHEEEW